MNSFTSQQVTNNNEWKRRINGHSGTQVTTTKYCKQRYNECSFSAVVSWKIADSTVYFCHL